MNRKVKWFLIALFWLALWQVAAMTAGNSLLLPSPVETVRGLVTLLADNKFYMDVAATIGRCAAAMLLALVAGLILALASYRYRLVRDLLSLPVSFFKAVPVMAIAIYVILLLSAGNVPVLVCWVMCFPIVYTNLLTGLDSLDPDLKEMADMYKIEGNRRARYLYLPSLFPYFRSAASIIAGMSWKAVVTAEVLSVPQFSLGYELMNSKYYLNTDLLFAYVAVIILISILFEKLITGLLKRFEPHAYEGSHLRAAAGEEQNTIKTEVKAPRVELSDISKSFGDKTVLDKFCLTLESGKTTALMGVSGCGKTTVGRLILGREKPDSGEIAFSEDSNMAVLFQEDRLLPWLNVYDNVALVAQGRNEMILDMLSAAGLGNEKWDLPSQLSGGMCRRLAIVRAFAYAEASGCGLIVADEAFRGLDEDTRSSVIDDLWKPCTAGRTVLFITHSEEEASRLADTTVSM